MEVLKSHMSTGKPGIMSSKVIELLVKKDCGKQLDHELESLANTTANLLGPQYFRLIIEDFNYNHINNGGNTVLKYP